METIKEEVRAPKIVMCMPGNEFSKEVMLDTIKFLFEAKNNGWEVILGCDYDPNVYYVRNKLLGGDVGRGPGQKPFDGKIDYDYVLWVDSDIRYNFAMVERLISHNKDVCCGLYRMKDMRNFAVVREMNDAYFAENRSYKFFDVDELDKLIKSEALEPFEVDYTGMGLCVVSKKAVESLEYPWFRPIWMNVGDMKDFTSEDVGFCIQLRKAGNKIWCDPKVVAGHMKMIPI